MSDKLGVGKRLSLPVIILIICGFFTALFLTGCGDDTGGGATVSSVTVNPPTVSVEKGGTHTFSADVAGTNNPGQTVKWSIEQANKNDGTAINGRGKLTVAAAETLTALTVKATSTEDTSKSGTAIVTVTAGITYTVSQAGGAGGTADSTGIAFTFSAAIDSLNVTAADIALGGAAVKGLAATFTKSSVNTWLLSPITVTNTGPATLKITKNGIETAEKTATVYKRAGNAPAGYWNVIWELNGGAKGSGLYPDQTEKGKTLAKPSNPGKAGNTFAGWYTDSSCTAQAVFPVTVTADITLYAGWNTGTYTVIYNADGGSPAPASPVTVNYNSAVPEPPAMTKPGYAFDKWYIAASGSTAQAVFPITVTANVYLYARWNASAYTVTYNADGGSPAPASPATVNYNSAVPAPPAMSKPGYAFDKWYTDSAYTTAANFPITVTANITLYARWNISAYTVTYNADGGSPAPASPVTVNYNSAVPAPPAMTKPDYAFDKWYTDSAYTTAANFPITVTANTTLYARWKIIPGPEPVSGDSAIQYLRENGIVIGWNLGDSLDAVRYWQPPVVADELAWGKPLAAQALFNGVKARGFNIVRIPVTWIGHIGPAPDYKLSPERLERVAAVVTLAKNAGLKVIINIHHDDREEFSGWLNIRDAVENQQKKAEITARYGRVWTQIAERFINYGDWLIFESMNEVHDGEWGWSAAYKANPKAQFDILNEWNQLFTDNVRKAGGNNATRYLMYPSYNSALEALLPDSKFDWAGGAEIGKHFKLPNDSAGSGKQIVTFHFYDPNDFSLNGEAAQWDTTAFRNTVENAFGRCKQYYIDKDIPVVIGEIGPSRYSGTNPSDIALAKANRVEWVKFVFEKAKYYGLIPVCWDNGNYEPANGENQFGLIDRSNGQPNSTESGDLIQTMMTAVGNR